jgi:ketosteroid isomerase-like protein
MFAYVSTPGNRLGDTALAMSEGNVEVVRASWAAWLRRDIDAVVDHLDSDLVFDMTHFRDWPDRSYRGVEGFRRFSAAWLELWEEFEAGLDEIRDAPDGRVVALIWARGKGRQSGLAMGFEWAQIATFSDGKITRLDGFHDRATGLKAAGLQE